MDARSEEGRVRPPNATRAVQRIICDASARLPEMSHVDASRVLVLLGEARRASRASVRPMHFAETASRRSASGAFVRPLVRIEGRSIRYLLTLRPRFFLDGTPATRIATVLHEMLHFSEAFDGTLHAERRHAVMGESFQRLLSPLVERYLEDAPDTVWESMAIDGEVRARMWLEKPGLTALRIEPDGRRIVRGRQVYTERQTFFARLHMKTAKRDRVRGGLTPAG